MRPAGVRASRDPEHLARMERRMSTGKRALVLMPPFSLHAERRNWDALEDFYNPMGVFEEVWLVSLGETRRNLPDRLGTLRIVPLFDTVPRFARVVFGDRLYGRLDPVAAAVRRLAIEVRADLLIQRYGSPLWHGVPIVWAARQIGAPSIVTFQNDNTEVELLYEGLARVRRNCTTWFPRRFVERNSTAIWAVSEFVREYVISRGVPPRKVVAISNKDSIEKFTREPDPATVRDTFARLDIGDWIDEHPLFLAVGRLIPQKNYPRMLSAFKTTLEAHPRARFLIIGDGEEEARLRAQLRRDGLEESVRLITRYQTAAELMVLYHRAAALLFCSLHEGQGRVVYEAMACGAPVIGSDVGPIPEMVIHERNGLLVDPLDVDQLAQAIARFCRDEVGRRSMGRACRETGGRYDLARINPQEAALYRSVLEGSFGA
jgi:glycosyltransferase involved in cell wall biosynthesis